MQPEKKKPKFWDIVKIIGFVLLTILVIVFAVAGIYFEMEEDGAFEEFSLLGLVESLEYMVPYTLGFMLIFLSVLLGSVKLSVKKGDTRYWMVGIVLSVLLLVPFMAIPLFKVDLGVITMMIFTAIAFGIPLAIVIFWARNNGLRGSQIKIDEKGIDIGAYYLGPFEENSNWQEGIVTKPLQKHVREYFLGWANIKEIHFEILSKITFLVIKETNGRFFVCKEGTQNEYLTIRAQLKRLGKEELIYPKDEQEYQPIGEFPKTGGK